MKPGLQRELQVAIEIEDELQITRKVFLAESRRLFAQSRLLSRRRADQARLAVARDPRNQQIPEVARQLAAEMVQAASAALQFLHDLDHPLRVATLERLGHILQ